MVNGIEQSGMTHHSTVCVCVGCIIQSKKNEMNKNKLNTQNGLYIRIGVTNTFVHHNTIQDIMKEDKEAERDRDKYDRL